MHKKSLGQGWKRSISLTLLTICLFGIKHLEARTTGAVPPGGFLGGSGWTSCTSCPATYKNPFGQRFSCGTSTCSVPGTVLSQGSFVQNVRTNTGFSDKCAVLNGGTTPIIYRVLENLRTLRICSAFNCTDTVVCGVQGPYNPGPFNGQGTVVEKEERGQTISETLNCDSLSATIPAANTIGYGNFGSTQSPQFGGLSFTQGNIFPAGSGAPAHFDRLDPIEGSFSLNNQRAFFVTEKGLLSFGTNSLSASTPINGANLLTFPNEVRAVAVKPDPTDSNSVWVGTTKGGILQVNSNGTAVNRGFKISTGFWTDYVFNIATNDTISGGVVAIATPAGVGIKAQGYGTLASPFRQLTTDDGLASMMVTDVAFQGETLWVAHSDVSQTESLFDIQNSHLLSQATLGPSGIVISPWPITIDTAQLAGTAPDLNGDNLMNRIDVVYFIENVNGKLVAFTFGEVYQVGSPTPDRFTYLLVSENQGLSWKVFDTAGIVVYGAAESQNSYGLLLATSDGALEFDGTDWDFFTSGPIPLNIANFASPIGIRHILKLQNNNYFFSGHY
jgi:hypothetical protein